MRRTPIHVAILAALALPVVAQAQQASEAKTLDTMIVTGTRVADRTLAESQSPIDVITPEALQATGTTELATALARALPSLNFPRPALTDGTSGVRPAQLRGLAPDQVLVLVNGKRRHTSALVNVNGTIGRGSSAVDMNAIPIAAIDRVEVLRDGASALYGTDAIAGVVNIVLKGAGSGGSIALSGGQYSEGDGQQWQLAGDAGIGFADGRGSLHLAGQVGHQHGTNRAGAYAGPAASANTGNNAGLGEIGFIVGDPQVEARALSANTSLQVGENANLYATLMLGKRDIVSNAFHRSKTHGGQAALLAQVYPNGFVPEIHQESVDRSLVLGAKGATAGGWNWDFSYNHGNNALDFHTQNSINYSLGAGSPRRFYDGALEYTQDVFNGDFTKALDMGLAYPATLSLGAEYRNEKWKQSAGEPNSYFGTGAQGFAGFTPRNAGSHDRHSYALYAGLEADVTEAFSAGAAVRYEDYSDFGNQTSGKLSARYAFSDAVALRGTVASGFRAPALAQQHYQAVTTNITNSVSFEAGTFPATSAAARALGAEPLQAETSLSYSLGLVLQPTERLYVTIDAYQIQIDDRIVLSSNLPLANNAAAQALLASLGITNVTSALLQQRHRHPHPRHRRGRQLRGPAAGRHAEPHRRLQPQQDRRHPHRPEPGGADRTGRQPGAHGPRRARAHRGRLPARQAGADRQPGDGTLGLQRRRHPLRQLHHPPRQQSGAGPDLRRQGGVRRVRQLPPVVRLDRDAGRGQRGRHLPGEGPGGELHLRPDPVQPAVAVRLQRPLRVRQSALPVVS